MRVWIPLISLMVCIACAPSAKHDGKAAPAEEAAAPPAEAAAPAEKPEPAPPTVSQPAQPLPETASQPAELPREPARAEPLPRSQSEEAASQNATARPDATASAVDRRDMAPTGTPEAAAPATPPAAVPVQEAVAKAIKKAPFSDALTDIYQRLGGAPVFFDGTTPRPTVAAVRRLVSGLGDHRIDAKPYKLPPAKGPKTAGEAAAHDVLLMSAVLQYVLDFRFIYYANPKHFTEDVPALVAEKQAEIAAMVAGVFPDVEIGLKALWPTDPLYAAVQAALPEWERWSKRWKEQPDVEFSYTTFQPGDSHRKLRQLQARLKWQELYDGPITGKLDEKTMAAVSVFQAMHGLIDDGKPGRETFEALRVNVRHRRHQLSLALQRLRENRAQRLGLKTWLMVHLARFNAELWDQGKVLRRHNVIVGTNDLDYSQLDWRQGHLNRTPILTTRLTRMVFNPIWIIPQRIRQQEVDPKQAASGNYYKRKGYREVTGKDGSSHLVQGAGKGNALGRVKFLLENTNSIYLHDTDKPHLFGRGVRDMSHGCVRVEDATGLATFIAEWRAGKTKEEVQKMLDSGKSRVVHLDAPLDVLTDYNTVGLAADGEVVLYADVYGYDKAHRRGELPVRGWRRWGSPAMRPRNVPRIPFKDFKKLKNAGGLAPMTWPTEG